ncbi:hypothetical protein MU1_36760 [Paenibacillus glycanilyticus]|uniref:Uncharacterized protein n=1 Tax=Paenibacillus glycanilyticus TaxID=126569 RepID=A0ABQ6GED2_9BACL|nr:hypothetical protein MU1_36760 [Paenibacillus glycanilyticus]
MAIAVSAIQSSTLVLLRVMFQYDKSINNRIVILEKQINKVRQKIIELADT